MGPLPEHPPLYIYNLTQSLVEIENVTAGDISNTFPAHGQRLCEQPQLGWGPLPENDPPYIYNLAPFSVEADNLNLKRN